MSSECPHWSLWSSAAVLWEMAARCHQCSIHIQAVCSVASNPLCYLCFTRCLFYNRYLNAILFVNYNLLSYYFILIDPERSLSQGCYHHIEYTVRSPNHQCSARCCFSKHVYINTSLRDACTSEFLQ